MHIKQLIAASALLCAQLNAANLYISTAGSDSTGDGTIGNPWRTFQYGMIRMAAGDTLYARGGTYNEAHIPNQIKSGTSAANPTRIISYPGELAVLRTLTATAVHSIAIADRSNIWIEGIKVKADTHTGDGIKINSGNNITITNVAFEDSYHGMPLAVYGASNLLVINCTFTNWGSGPYVSTWNPPHAIYGNKLTNSVIKGNRAYGPLTEKVKSYSTYHTYSDSSAGNSTNVVFEGNYSINYYTGFLMGRLVNCSLRNNISVVVGPNAGFTAAYSSSGISFDNNTAYGGSYAYSLSTVGGIPTGTIFRNNIGWGQTSASSVNNLGTTPSYWTNNLLEKKFSSTAGMVNGENFISASYDPGFIDAPDDLGILTTGWAWERGLDLSATFNTDYDGITRPQFDKWDIGAKEVEEDGSDTPPTSLFFNPIVTSGRDVLHELDADGIQLIVWRGDVTTPELSGTWAWTGPLEVGVHFTVINSETLDPASLTNWTIPNGTNQFRVTILPIATGVYDEPGLSKTITLQPGSGYTVSGSPGTVYWVDHESNPAAQRGPDRPGQYIPPFRQP